MVAGLVGYARKNAMQGGPSVKHAIIYTSLATMIKRSQPGWMVVLGKKQWLSGSSVS
jgi:hypothetical protein